MASALVNVCLDLFESALRNVGSAAGIYLRRIYYRRRLKACGKNLRIDCGVFIVTPGHVSLGDDVILDKHVTIIAGPAGDPRRTKHVPNPNCDVAPGYVTIGSCSHLGIGTIVQGHGGVAIGDFFTTSSHCMIYSLSNDPHLCMAGTVGAGRNEIHYVETPVKIGRNVWLGLQSIVIGNTIGDNVFLKPNSVVLQDIAPNQKAQGQPATAVGPRFAGEDDPPAAGSAGST